MPAITLTDLSFSFTAEPLLAGITLTVGDGERACLVGPNGCGKTTLLRLIAGDLVPDSGTVRAPRAAPVPDALAMVEAGANRLGLSASAVVLEGLSV